MCVLKLREQKGVGLEVLGGKTLLEWERSGFGSIRGKDAVGVGKEWVWKY